MRVASLTLIFRRSVGTLQPMRPLGRVGSKFNLPSEDQCQRAIQHSKLGFCFYLTLRMQIQPLNSLKTVSKSGRSVLDDRHDSACFWCAFSGLRDWTLRDWSRRDILWPDWLNWWVCPWVPAFEIQVFLTPKTLELTGMCGVINALSCNAMWMCAFASHELISTTMVTRLYSYDQMAFPQATIETNVNFSTNKQVQWVNSITPSDGQCIIRHSINSSDR